ncbi:hypothetical protein EUTSA_v10015788mg [Eutrema salsugineum]|uniref:F-box associated beta-propeller type 1 domain-containing protein n=2 Tax=Eutrema salsugineum TaxID=72664 RepID=V4N8Q6_EUTSA|nr:hypothetical protein EUTSA_v10015788mg [Eutrema salsugineum]
MAEILPRLPFESFLKFRTVCFKWDYWIMSKEVISRQLDRSSQRFLRTEELLHMVNPIDHSVASTNIPDFIEQGYFISSLIHCDGLFLCNHSNSRTAEDRLFLWNPFRRLSRWIPDPDPSWKLKVVVGLGYKVRHYFQIVRIWQTVGEDEEGPLELRADVYDTKAKNWRRLNDAPLWEFEITGSQGLSIRGNMFWAAWTEEILSIVSFNFTEEAFSIVCPSYRV